MIYCSRYILLVSFVLFYLNGCTESGHDAPPKNISPKTYLWLFPDSTITEGQSRQHIRWWGEDPDGLVRGYLFASGKLYQAPSPVVFSDTILWRWRTTNDSVVAFPLRLKRDTFQVVVRAVDNRLAENLTDYALVRFVNGGTAYWDRNENGIFDSSDTPLPSLAGATDPKGAFMAMPLLNQPPSIIFAPNPNEPTETMQQPETTFTAATFAWVGSDPDGDATIARYEIALNDTTDPARIVSINSNIRLISLVVPRSRSNSIPPRSGVEVAADIWSGNFSTSRTNIARLSHLKLDNNNTFFVRARDIADSASPFIRMPADSTRKWYVKNPVGNVLIVNDYVASDREAALAFYRTILDSSGFQNAEMLNIGLGLSAQDKYNAQYGKRFGSLVPPFLDPAFIYTLHLFDAVCWYTDGYPSIPVAQLPLWKYTQDPDHHGKVIFSTMFLNFIDPRGALVDFAPLDSVSSVDLGTSRLLPSLGDTRIPRNYFLPPDQGRIADGFDTLRFNLTPAFHSNVYLRTVYKRTDAEYIYRIQADASPQQYANFATYLNLNAIEVLPSGGIISCGANGYIFYSADGGSSWKSQLALNDTSQNLNGIYFADNSNGWIVGKGGTIIQTADAGNVWITHSYFTFENLKHIEFTSNTVGYICGSNGILLRTSDGGVTWDFLASHTSANLHSIHFVDPEHGIAVGDSGIVIRTSDGGATWSTAPKAISRALYSVAYLNANTVIAVGARGGVVTSTNGGVSWSTRTALRDRYSSLNVDLSSVFFNENQTGWISGANGTLFKSTDNGATWPQLKTGIEDINGGAQNISSITFKNASEGYLAGSGGLMMKSIDGGSAWSIIPGGEIPVAVIDGIGSDGKRSFVFFGLPLHLLNGNQENMKQFFRVVLNTEFGL